LAAAPASIAADGTSPSMITVTVLDAKRRPVAGATVTFAATGTGNTLTQPSAPTNASGIATGTLASTVAESKTISATVNGTTALAQHATVMFVAGSPANARSTVIAAPTSVAADGTSSSTITVTVRDASGNPVAGAIVTLAATGSGNTLVQPSGPTGAGGVA